ncbi:hypothetical protein VNO80_34086 [Phaseolus coccineus]|uniref:Gnk2-homologous domain-containing protein n=1 Tax=Phaseolus coccineus TaxID=3886 RepID=A0AAN9QC13_PHACN
MVVYYYPRLTNKSMASFNLVHIFSLLSFIINFVTTEAQFDRSISGPRCAYFNRTTPKSAFEFNLRAVLSDLSSNATANNKPFYNTTVATKNHPESTVYGMFFCWGDVPPQLCSQCVASATKAVFSDPDQVFFCSLATYAVITYRDCMIRYSNISFFSTPDLNSGSVSCVSVDVSNKTSLMSLYPKTINEVVEKAANSPVGEKKYATKEARIAGLQTLYCEAQCTPDLSPQDCRKCLNVSVVEAQQTCPQDLPMTDGNPSCNMRCDVYPFYRPGTSPPPLELVEVTHSSDTDSQALTELSHNCSSNETMIAADTTFRSYLKTLFTSLSSKSTANSGFFNNTVDTVSGFFMCFGDLSPTLCEQCIQNATPKISSECPSSKEATIWYNHCLLHYSDHPSLPTLDTTPTYRHFNIVNTFKPNQLQSFFTWTLANSLSQLLFDIQAEHTTTKNYGTKSGKLNDKQTLYTLAQCRPDVSSEDCNTCLDSIIRKEIPWCCLGSPEGKVLYPSCYIMFGLSPFHSEASLVDARKPDSSSPATGHLPFLQYLHSHVTCLLNFLKVNFF